MHGAGLLNRDIVGLTEPRRGLGDGLEHRLDVGREAADHTKDLACRALAAAILRLVVRVVFVPFLGVGA